LQLYDKTIKEQLDSDIIEEAPPSTKYYTHYLPHHAVFKADSNFTKIRIVFAANTKIRGNKSLNELMYRGRYNCQIWQEFCCE
jgi:hypothetical protein